MYAFRDRTISFDTKIPFKIALTFERTGWKKTLAAFQVRQIWLKLRCVTNLFYAFPFCFSNTCQLASAARLKSADIGTGSVSGLRAAHPATTAISPLTFRVGFTVIRTS